MTDAIDLVRPRIKLGEGEVKEHGRHIVYPCPAKKWTLGWGRNVQERGISDEEAEMLLDNDIADCVKDLGSFFWWNYLSEEQRAALIEMRFILGPTRFRNFKQMIKALGIQDYREAALQVVHSDFYDQVGDRAERISKGLLG